MLLLHLLGFLGPFLRHRLRRLEAVCRRKRRSKILEVRVGIARLLFQKVMLVVEASSRGRKARIWVHFILWKMRILVIIARRFTMEAKTFILDLRLPRALCSLLSIKMEEKMIRMVLQEETGGRVLFITRNSSPLQVNLYILRKIQTQGIDSSIAV